MRDWHTLLRLLIATVIASSVAGSTSALGVSLIGWMEEPASVIPGGPVTGIVLLMVYIVPMLIVFGAAIATIAWGPIVFALGSLLWMAGRRWPRLRNQSVWTGSGAILSPMIGHMLPGWLIGNPFDRPDITLLFALAGALCARLFLWLMMKDRSAFSPPPATATAPSTRPDPRSPPA